MKLFLIASVILLLLGGAFYGYYGGFKQVKIRVEKQGGELLVYKEMKGSYAKSGQLMDELYNDLLKTYKAQTYKGFGIYYDNPQKVKKEQLRSEIGCILEPKDSAKVAQIKENYKIKRFPEKNYLVTEFPYKGKLSIFFSLFKVYPALNNYVKEQGYKEEGAVMEIYDMPNKKIMYRKEIVK